MITQDILRQLSGIQVVSTVSQTENEREWLAVRTRGIGGSDIGAICGVSPFTSARQVYFAKTGQFEEAIKPSAASAERMHFGHMLEQIVASEFAKRALTAENGKEGWYLKELGGTVCRKEFAWQRANVDRLICDAAGTIKGILECKTTSEYNNDEWERGDLLLSYVYQLNWYLHVLDLRYGAFACLVGGNKFYYYEVFRNDELINETLIPAATHFWYNNVIALKEPDLQAADTEFVNNTYAHVNKNSEVSLDGDIENELAKTVVECKKQIKELTAIMEAAQNRLKDKLQEHEIGYTQDWTIKWSPRTQSRVDTTLLKKTFPSVYEQCKKQVSFRVMTIRGLEV